MHKWKKIYKTKKIKTKDLQYVIRLHSRKLTKQIDDFLFLNDCWIISSPQVIHTFKPHPVYDAKEVYDE